MQDSHYYRNKSASKMEGREKTEVVLELESYIFNNESNGTSMAKKDRIHRIKGWKVINLEKLFELQQDSTVGVQEESYVYNPYKVKNNEQ